MNESQSPLTEEQKRKLLSGYTQDMTARNAENEERQAAWRQKRDEELAAQTARQVESGQTTLTTEGQSAAASENDIKSEGVRLGNPENIVFGEKRTDFKPIK